LGNGRCWWTNQNITTPHSATESITIFSFHVIEKILTKLHIPTQFLANVCTLNIRIPFDDVSLVVAVGSNKSLTLLVMRLAGLHGWRLWTPVTSTVLVWFIFVSPIDMTHLLVVIIQEVGAPVCIDLGT